MILLGEKLTLDVERDFETLGEGALLGGFPTSFGAC